MAKRAKKSEGGTAVADASPFTSPVAAQAIPSANGVPLDGLAAMMAVAAAGGATDTSKKSKKGAPELDVDADTIKNIKSFVKGAARKKAAEGDMAASRFIQPKLVDAFLKKMRSEDTFFKTVDVPDEKDVKMMSFSIGRLTLANPTDDRPLAKIEADLKTLLGADGYAKYIKPQMALSIKASKLEGYAGTMMTLQFLQKALGAQFGEYFDSAGSLELHSFAVSKDDTVEYLTKDFLTSSDFARKLEPAFGTKLIQHQYVTFKPTQNAIAAAGEQLAKEMEAILDAPKKDAEIAALKAEIASLKATAGTK